MTYENVCGLVGRGAASYKLGGSFLDALHGNAAHNIGIGISVSNDALAFGVLAEAVSTLIFPLQDRQLNIHRPCSRW